MKKRELTKAQSTYLIIVGFLSTLGLFMVLASTSFNIYLLKKLGFIIFVGFSFTRTFHYARWRRVSKKILYLLILISLGLFIAVIIMPLR